MYGVFQDNEDGEGPPHMFNLFVSPGHVDFSSVVPPVEFGRLSSTICWSCIDLVHLLLGVLLSMVPSSTMHFRTMLGYTCLDTQRVDSS